MLGTERGHLEIEVPGSGDIRDPHAEGLGTECGRVSNSSGTDNEEELVAEVHAEELVHSELPILRVLWRTGVSVGLDQSSGGGEDEEPGDIGGAFGNGVGGVADDNPPAFAGVDVDIVESDGEVADNFQLVPSRIKNLFVNGIRVHRNEGG